MKTLEVLAMARAALVLTAVGQGRGQAAEQGRDGDKREGRSRLRRGAWIVI